MKSEYKVVESNYLEELQNTIDLYLRDGWEVAGGLAIYSETYTARDGDIESHPTYLQALIKKPKI